MPIWIRAEGPQRASDPISSFPAIPLSLGLPASRSSESSHCCDPSLLPLSPMVALFGQKTCICVSGGSAAGPCCCGSRDRHNPGGTAAGASCTAPSYSSPARRQSLHGPEAGVRQVGWREGEGEATERGLGAEAPVRCMSRATFSRAKVKTEIT